MTSDFFSFLHHVTTLYWFIINTLMSHSITHLTLADLLYIHDLSRQINQHNELIHLIYVSHSNLTEKIIQSLFEMYIPDHLCSIDPHKRLPRVEKVVQESVNTQ